VKKIFWPSDQAATLRDCMCGDTALSELGPRSELSSSDCAEAWAAYADCGYWTRGAAKGTVRHCELYWNGRGTAIPDMRSSNSLVRRATGTKLVKPWMLVTALADEWVRPDHTEEEGKNWQVQSREPAPGLKGCEGMTTLGIHCWTLCSRTCIRGDCIAETTTAVD
jgi:hypothetical protein